MKKNSRKRLSRQSLIRLIALLTILAFILTLMCITASAADVGNQFGDGDDAGGGSSGSSDDSGSLFFLFYIIYDLFGIPGILIVIVIVVVGGVIFKKKGKGVHTNASPQVNTVPKAVEDGIVAQIQQEDPAFAAEQFKTYANDVFLRVQEAWEAKNWKIVRPYESDKLFAVHERQLQEFIDNKKTNHMDGQCILSTSIAAYKIDGENDVLTVRLQATVIDYTTDDETGKIIIGSKTERHNRVYRLEFIRSHGTKTSTQAGLTSHECPSCGAPIEVSSTGQCEYCKNIITNGQYGWVLNTYSQWFATQI